MEIEELPDLKTNRFDNFKYRDMELLEYVWKVAKKFHPIIPYDEDEPEDSSAPSIFADRYSQSQLAAKERYARHKEIYPTSTEDFETYSKRKQLDASFKDRYLNNEDLQNTIEAYGLDVSKFWYLLLFAYDYIEDFGTNTPTLMETTLKEINEFEAKLKEATSITLKKDNRKSYSTEREDILKIIKASFEYYTNTYNNIVTDDCSDEDKRKKLKDIGLDSFIDGRGHSVDTKTKVTLEISYKKWYFAKMFLYFLEDKKTITLPQKKVKVSKDKMIFISRLLYTVGYAGKDYNEEYDEEGNKNRKLSNLLRKYNNENFPLCMHNYYW